MIEELAGRLAKAVAGRTAIAPLSDDVPGLDAATAYAVQAQAREQAGPLAEIGRASCRERVW